MRFKAKQFARATNFEVHIYPYKGVDITDVVNTTMDYEPLTLHENSTDLPLKVFQAQLPQSKKYITLVFEPVNEDSVNVVISGNTWAFRDQLEAHGCPGARQDNESRTYYRYMTDRSRIKMFPSLPQKTIIWLCIRPGLRLRMLT